MAGMTTATINISQPDALDRKGELGENWNKWKQNFKIYLIASGVNEADKTACALFLHTIGQYGRDIYNELELSDFENLTIRDLYEKFDKYCNPRSNLAFVRYQFFNTKQAKQPFDAFLLALKQKSKNCEFGDLADSLMMTQIIAGISNKKLQERLFLIDDLDLEKTVQECRAAELAESHVQLIPGGVTRKRPEKKSSEAKEKPTKNKTEQKPKKAPESKENSGNTVNSEAPKKINCKFCGGFHVHGSCPAFGSTCKVCGKPNHYANVCKNKK